MCGINGIFNYSSVSIATPRAYIEGMNSAVRHRGPDGTGVWSDEASGIHLGHQRLSILDLSENGHQPMRGAQGDMIVFNGEIYNFRQLRNRLPGYEYRSESDTEVLLALYEKYGEQCLELLNGMFAFGIWDGKRGKLFLARDRVGIKPLYYTTVGGVLAFSSEIKSLLTLPWVSAELDEEALYHFLTYNRVAPPATVFRNICKMHPGHLLVAGKNGIERNEQYWEVAYADYVDFSENELCELILDNLEQSVHHRMVSDVPVGAFLSGGVDSSAIVSRMRNQHSGDIKTYSIGFENSPDYDERKYAESVANAFQTEHHEQIVSPQDLIEFLPRVVDIYDEPLADATSIPIYFLTKLARENGSIVVLTGDGADELFCGYGNWMRYVKSYRYYYAFMNLPVAARKLIASIYERIAGDTVIKEILMRAACGQELFWGGAGGFKESVKRSLISDDYAARMSRISSYAQILDYKGLYEKTGKHLGKGGEVDWMTFLGLKYIVPNFYMYRADRMGMAHSVELRVPYLDHNFVNMALSIPSRWKIMNGVPKYILKKSLEGILPNDSLYRRKQGFCVPLNEWAGEVMVGYIEDNIKAFCAETGLFKARNIRWQLEATKSGSKNYIHGLWNIYFLMGWFKKWLL